MCSTPLIEAGTLQAARIHEYAEALHIRLQAETCMQLFPDEDIAIYSVSEGAAIATLPEFGAKLNRISGMGLGKQDDDVEELARVEGILTSAGREVTIHVNPYTDKSISQWLLSNNYYATSFSNALLYSFSDAAVAQLLDTPTEKTPGLRVRQAAATDKDEFLQHSIMGFKENGRSLKLLRTLAQSAALRDDTTLYIATIDDEVAGTAALAIMQTPYGRIAYFYLDSTLPQYRRRGVQAALIRARLLDTHRQGVKYATMITHLGVGSSRNAERLGFKIAYIKTKFTKFVQSE